MKSEKYSFAFDMQLTVIKIINRSYKNNLNSQLNRLHKSVRLFKNTNTAEHPHKQKFKFLLNNVMAISKVMRNLNTVGLFTSTTYRQSCDQFRHRFDKP